jgi:hypothetical protein
MHMWEGAVKGISEAVVRIQSEWNGWHSAEASLDDLEDLHWRQPSGAPHPLLHAFIRCTRITGGDIPHDQARTGCPHRMLVCVLKRHVLPSVYAAIAQRAGAATGAPIRATVGATAGRAFAR